MSKRKYRSKSKGTRRRRETDEQITERTGATLEDRKEWVRAVNESLEKMRAAQKADDPKESARWGDYADRVFKMGPRKYKEFKNQ